MNRSFGLSLVSAALVLALGVLASAQPPAPVLPPPRGEPSAATGPEPTYPSAKASAGVKLGPLSLRGRILAKGKPPAALLEVDGKMYTVGKGSVVTGANNTVLRILDIDSSGVRVESSPSKDVFLLR